MLLMHACMKQPPCRARGKSYGSTRIQGPTWSHYGCNTCLALKGSFNPSPHTLNCVPTLRSALAGSAGC